jgi:hypothetical protein
MDATLSETDQLVLVMAIRKTISGAEEPPVSDIIETGVLQMAGEILRFNDTCEEIRVMKVMPNLSKIIFKAREHLDPDESRLRLEARRDGTLQPYLRYHAFGKHSPWKRRQAYD